MNIIEKMFLFIKNIFIKQNEVKKLQKSKIDIGQDEKEQFINSLKITNRKNENNKKVETLICPGDGLGIQKKITY